MDKKKLIIMLAAIAIAVGSALAVRTMLAGQAAPNANAAALKVPKGPKVLVALRSLPVGAIISAEAISYKQWPAELVKDAYFAEGKSDISSLLGTVVRYPITAGEPLTQESLVKPGERGFLAAALAPGMRAVSIPVTEETGVSGFIFPGDRVDIVLTQTIGSQGSALKASETILSNIRVLASDQFATERKGEDGGPLIQSPKTVTLEVTPRIAEKIAVARSIGALSLSLRALTDGQGNLEKAIASGDVQIPDNASFATEEALLRQAMARPIDKTTSATTGGDVSRYARSTPPREGAGQSNSSSNGLPPALAQAQGQAQTQTQASGAATPRRPQGPSVRVSRGGKSDNVAIGKNGQAVYE